jgi:hypothetical protein
VEIPLSIYEEITGQGELPPPVDAADFERRKHRRVPFGCRATIFPERKTGDNTPSVVMVRDMSVAGLSILNTEPLKPGTPFLVEFRGRHDRPVKIRCTTARCESGGAGGAQFVVGATYESLLTEELKPAPKEATAPPLAELVAATTDDTAAPVDEDAIAEALQGDDAGTETPEAAPAEAGGEDPVAATDESTATELNESESESEAQSESEPDFELVDEEPQEIPSERPKPAEPPQTKPVAAKPAPAPAAKPAATPAPKPAAPAAAAPRPRTSSLFSGGGAKIKPLSELPDSTYETGEAAPKASAAVSAPPPETSGPTFRDVPMPMPAPEPKKQAAVEMEPAPHIPHIAHSDGEHSGGEHVSGAHITGGGKHHEILARAKETLLAQSNTIKGQQQQIEEQRQQMKKLGDELAELKQTIEDLQGRVTEDDSAFSELAEVLDQAVPRESRPKTSEAA